jgi:GDP-L-fucose synthase
MGSLEGRRVMVTGGGGFLGSAVVDRVRSHAVADVFVPRSRDYDLRHRADIDRALADGRPDVVIHLAAVVGGIGANRENPGRFFYENAIMGIELFEAARVAGIEKFVTIGTVCAYPKFTPVPFHEDDLWNGYPEETNAPYGVAKKSILVGAQAYRRQYGTNAIFLLPANLYGPRDNFHPTNAHVIADLIRKMHETPDEIVLWGDGTPTREFLFVDDAADAFLLAAQRYDGADPVNVGPGMEISIRDLASLIAELTGFSGEITWDTSMPNGQPRRSLDPSRAKELFGFEARTPLREGLERTIAWYRSSVPTLA